MKKSFFKSSILLFCSIVSLSTHAQYTNIPDPNFETYLREKGLDDGTENDGKALAAPISNMVVLDIKGYGIKNLTGIKAFTSLTTINCKQNQLTSLDVSNMTKLTTIYCDSNDITSINLSNCANLQILTANKNKLTSLTYLNSPYLYDLRVANNLLSTLSISGLDYLQTLNIENNNFSSLDVKNKTYLQKLNCKGNPLLSCIQVTNVFYATENFQKDATASFRTNCKAATGYTAIPDSAFEANLRLYDLDDSQVNDGKVPTNFIQESTVTSLSLSNKGIKDLTGIRAFKNLTYLDVSYNKLRLVYLDSMNLTNLIVSNNPDLYYLMCGNNKINYLGVNNLPSLTYLFIYNNKIQSLPLSSFTNLAFFDSENNLLTSIFNSAMVKLRSINFRGNNVENVFFDATSDPIGEKRIAKTNAFASLEHLDCGNNPIKSITVSNLPNLKYLNCSNTTIDSLNISALNSLDTLIANSNAKLTCIQVSNLTTANSKSNYTKDASAVYSTNCRMLSGIESEVENQLSFYPNPTSGQFTLQLGTASNVTIFNAVGTKFYQQNLQQGTNFINLQNVENGVYFIEVQNKNSNAIQKIEISK